MRGPRFDRAEGARRFLLARTPEEGTPTLAQEDLQHALRVLRLAPGDHLVGLDGRGGAWPLVVRSSGKRELDLVPAGEARREAERPRPHLVVAAPLPKGGRAEDLLDALSQLGLTRFVPLLTERTAPHARELSDGRRRRLERACAEALKQCGALWLPELGEPTSLEELVLEGHLALTLSPSAEVSLADRLRDAPPDTPRLFVLGPEGGLSPDEEAALAARGAHPARLGGHVLRIETACVAALAVGAR